MRMHEAGNYAGMDTLFGVYQQNLYKKTSLIMQIMPDLLYY